jgi:hypothetical protein
VAGSGGGFQCDGFMKLKWGARKGRGMRHPRRRGNSVVQRRVARRCRRVARRCSGLHLRAAALPGSGGALEAEGRRGLELEPMSHMTRWAGPLLS